MANPEHLKILKQGVPAWNEWREKNHEVRPDLTEADLVAVDLGTPDLRGENRHPANLTDADLRGANLQLADLRQVYLDGAVLVGANLYQVDLQDAVGPRADLSGANLGKANLTRASLRWANLCGVNLTGADLWQTNLYSSDLSDANLTDAVVGRTIFADNDLSTVIGLETTMHGGPSSIGIDTIYKSRGNIPEVFLRGCGVPEDFITYMKSLVGKAVEFYSCFISYSSKDDDFAQRLHADLQQKGVRCWFAPEDLKIGDKFRTRIDESIRIYDKLMVILSENSIRSSWIEEEVEATLEKERKQNKLALFPIRLDDAVMETEQAWAASLRRTRHIGDFRDWKDHDPYQKSFERLLRDLKA